MRVEGRREIARLATFDLGILPLSVDTARGTLAVPTASWAALRSQFHLATRRDDRLELDSEFHSFLVFVQHVLLARPRRRAGPGTRHRPA